MRPVMYLFLNRGLGMSTGKSAAQVAHAAVEAYRLTPFDMQNAWYVGNHYTKIVLLAENAAQLDTYERYINDRGFKTSLIIDEGRTEIPAHSKTALGVEIVDKSDEHVQATFGEFRLYPRLDEAGASTEGNDEVSLAQALRSRVGRRRPSSRSSRSSDR